MDMDLHDDMVIGLVGGMGPQAGVTLYSRILNYTPATRDQDHLSVMLMSFSKHIADRSAFLEGATDVNPAFHVADIILRLEREGAGIVGIACNTIYAPPIYDRILEALDKAGSQVTVIHMPMETCRYLQKTYADARRIGVMSTNGTYQSGLYENILRAMGYVVVVPERQFQNDVVHRLIYDSAFGIKANASRIGVKARQLFEQALRFYKDNACDAVILGCTELSMLSTEERSDELVVIDSMDVLARALVKGATCAVEAGKQA